MRVLMWFTIGFAVACCVSAYIGTAWWVALIAMIIALTLFYLKWKVTKVAAIVMLGLAVGSIWTFVFHSAYLQTAKNYDGKTVASIATISEYSYETDYGIAADAKIELDGKRFSARLYLNKKDALEPGDQVAGNIRLRLTINDSLQGQTYHQGDGIFLLGYVQEEAQITYADDVPFRFFGAKLRQKIKDVLKSVFPEDTLAFANALFLGDSSLLPYETDTDFKLSGIRHIIAVSGLHVSILMSVVFALCGRNRYLSAVFGIPLLFLFAAVVGFTPSVMRACIMQALMLLGMFLNKEYDPPTALAFSVLVMLGINPNTIVSVSFQLSAGCVIGILLLFERFNEYFLKILRAPKGKGMRARLSRWFASSVSITLSTFVTTTPLSAYYFGSVSIVGVLTNLLTLWVVSFIFCGIIVAVLLAFVWLPAAKLVAWIVSWPMRYVMFVAGVLADLPMSAVYTNSIYIIIWFVFCYVCIAVLFALKKKYPILMASSVAIGLVIAIAASWIEPQLDHYRVTVFDVGQGQSILIQYSGRHYLVDCGGDSDRIAADTVSQHLLSQGVTHLDGVIVTHYDRDHAGGLPNLLTSISTECLYLPDVEDESGTREILVKCGSKIKWISKVERERIGNLKIAMIPGKHETSDNERSMCILFQIEDYDILITGDRSSVGEKALLKAVDLPKVDVLVAGHHGSGTATSLELLESVQPDVAVISVSSGNYYGHPSDELLYRLRLFGCSIWRTDRDGTIVFRG